jgi:hypothetical protein
MLSDRTYQLLTAYVDGELSARQRKAVQRLLHRSAEARTLLQQLRHDALALGQLPRHRLGADFPPRVIQAVRERGLPRPRLAEAPRPQPWPAWAGISLAATVLFLVGLGSYAYFTLNRPGPAGGEVALYKVHDVPPAPVKPDPDPGPVSTPKKVQPPAKTTKPPDAPPSPPPVVKEAPKVKPAPPRPAPEASPETTLTLPVPEKEMFQPQAVEAVLPVIFRFGELDLTRLREEFRKDSGFRLEVPCRDSARALERLQAAFKGHGVALAVDPVAQARLKYKLRTNFVVYAEDLPPEQLAGILHQAGSEDKKADARHRAFDGLVVTRLSKGDRQELSTLLGIDPRQVPESRPDPRKPLSEKTAEQVTRALAKPPGTARAETGKPKPAEHLAMVLPYNPVRPRPGSAEVKRFLDGRKPPRPGSVQVLLVLREMKR